jgi:hypothetical protein
MIPMRYTICRYYPVLADSEQYFAFGVIGAEGDKVVLVVTNLTAHPALGGNPHPITDHVLRNSPEVLETWIENAMHLRCPTSGDEVLDRLASGNQSNIQLSPFRTCDDGQPLVETIQGIFRTECPLPAQTAELDRDRPAQFRPQSRGPGEFRTKSWSLNQDHPASEWRLEPG